MSKERKLLNDWISEYATNGDFRSVYKETMVLFAQPEQEPMGWMWTRNYEGGGYTNKVFQMKCEADEYAKDSESVKHPDLVRPLYLELYTER
jgi:hypothetical protein